MPTVEKLGTDIIDLANPDTKKNLSNPQIRHHVYNFGAELDACVKRAKKEKGDLWTTKGHGRNPENMGNRETVYTLDELLRFLEDNPNDKRSVSIRRLNISVDLLKQVRSLYSE